MGAAQFLQTRRWPFIEAHGAADFAGVKNGGDLAVGLLIKPEADLLTVFIGGEAMKVAVRNLRKGMLICPS